MFFLFFSSNEEPKESFPFGPFDCLKMGQFIISILKKRAKKCRRNTHSFIMFYSFHAFNVRAFRSVIKENLKVFKIIQIEKKEENMTEKRYFCCCCCCWRRSIEVIIIAAAQNYSVCDDSTATTTIKTQTTSKKNEKNTISKTMRNSNIMKNEMRTRGNARANTNRIKQSEANIEPTHQLPHNTHNTISR